MAQPIDEAGLARLLAETPSLFLPGCTGEPRRLRAMAIRQPGLTASCAVLTSFVAGLNDFATPLLTASPRVTGFFPAPGPRYRQLVSTYAGIDACLRACQPGLVCLPVTRPDARGHVWPGMSAEFVATALETAAVRVALVSDQLPVIGADDGVSLAAFTHVLTDDQPPLMRADEPVDDTMAAIGRHLATLIPDGATLQTGIGKVPAALFASLGGHRRLRIHTGMATGGLRGLVEAGALTREAPVVCATLLGDRDFYRWLDGRQDIALRPISHTHNAAVLAGLPALVAVNSAIEVDLLGQVNAERIGDTVVSAPGGLPDFAAAAHRAADGLSIIALPSTDARGRHSRIVARLAAGTPVSVARHDVDVVVTEQGIADLRGLTTGERALALVAVAAPAFRPALRAALDAALDPTPA